MKMNEAEDMKKERKESFKIVTVGFKHIFKFKRVPF
jgi:hypothetical protein